jgi:hypothetical protein
MAARCTGLPQAIRAGRVVDSSRGHGRRLCILGISTASLKPAGPGGTWRADWSNEELSPEPTPTVA